MCTACSELEDFIKNQSVRWGPTLNRHGRHYDHALQLIVLRLTHSRFAQPIFRDFAFMVKENGPALTVYQFAVKRKLHERHRANPERRKLMLETVGKSATVLDAECEEREQAEFDKLRQANRGIPCTCINTCTCIQSFPSI